ncbi:MAG: hypothetical protein ACKVRN_07380 [Pyrinomonadaceae bacterium]
MNLEETAASVLEQYPTGRRVDLQKEERLLEKFGDIAFTGFGIVIGIAVLGIIYAIVTKMILSGTQPFSGILLVAFITFAALSLGYVFWREALEERKHKVEAAPGSRGELTVMPEKLLHESTFEPIPSVTEDTTALLGVKRDTKKLD